MFMHTSMPTSEIKLYCTVTSMCVRGVQLNIDLSVWAARYSTRRLNKFTLKGVVFCFIFYRSLRVLQKLHDLRVDQCSVEL